MLNEVTCRQWWEIMHGWKENPLVEIRVQDGNKWLSGYFRDVDTLIREVKKVGNKGIYATINEINEACFSRPQCEQIIPAKTTTSGSDITRRVCLFLDFDPERPSDTNATDEEMKLAEKVMRSVFRFLRDEGFCEPIVAMSGNGYHCYYHIDIPATEEGDALIKDFVEVLGMMFYDEHVKIDKATTDKNRIAKVIGTSSVKGSSKSIDRPQRESRFIYVPQEWKVTPIAFIQKVAARLPKQEENSYRYGQHSADFDLEKFISDHNIEIVKRAPISNRGEKLVLKQCPFCGHGAPDSAIFRMGNGGYGFLCFHNSCNDKTWKDFRLFYDPQAYDRKTYEEHRFKRTYGSEKRQYTPPPVEEQTEELGPKWKNLSQIKRMKPSDYVFIPSGITELDRKIHGFCLGELTIFSGGSGAGKSTIINHFALNAIQRNFPTALWTGELMESRFLDWFDQMAAGKNFVKQVFGYDNFYTTPDHIRDKIHAWTENKFFLYNNDYGSGSTQLLADIDEAVKNKGVKFIILDNLMAMELDDVEGTENEQQTSLIKKLKNYAKKNLVHILFVCHPRKEQSFQLLRKESIAGTANLTNMADNVLIAHRVGKDFERRAESIWRKDEIAMMMVYSVILELVKNRSDGVVDFTTGVYYEQESRRIKNTEDEYIVYGWQEQPVQTTIEDIPEAIYNYDFEKQEEF